MLGSSGTGKRSIDFDDFHDSRTILNSSKCVKWFEKILLRRRVHCLTDVEA